MFFPIKAAMLTFKYVYPGYDIKVKEHKGSHVPAWDLFVRAPGAFRGKHVFTVIDFTYSREV